MPRLSKPSIKLMPCVTFSLCNMCASSTEFNFDVQHRASESLDKKGGGGGGELVGGRIVAVCYVLYLYTYACIIPYSVDKCQKCGVPSLQSY